MSQLQLVTSGDSVAGMPRSGDSAVVEGQVTLNSCVDVQIGPRYENIGDVIIQQNISVVGQDRSESVQSLSDYCRHFVVKDLAPRDSTKLNLFDYIGAWIVSNKYTSSIIVLLILIFIASIILFKIITLKEDNDLDLENFKGMSINSAELEREYPRSLKFVWREGWGAAQVTQTLLNNSLPVGRIIVIHTASAGTCNKFSICSQQVLSIQELHTDEDHGYGDIGYNFVIGGDGYIYVARGWDKVGAHSKGFNTGSLGVAFIGDFRVDELNENMKRAVERLLEFGVRSGKISGDYQVFGHCQVLASLPVSPGKNVMRFIRTWRHWNSTDVEQCKGWRHFT